MTTVHPVPGLFTADHRLHSSILAGGVVLHALNIYMTTTIMPSVIQDIGGLAYYAWATSLFMVGSIISAALSSRIVAAFGARGGYMLATLLFTVGTVLCALAPHMVMLLTGRLIQGFGGGLLYSLAYIVLRVVYPEQLWTKAMALISLMWGGATLIGPALGGVFAQVGWRWGFWSLVPFMAFFLLAAYRALPAEKVTEQQPVPVPQLALLSAAVLLLSVLSIVSTPAGRGLTLLVFMVIIVAFLALERRAANPLLPRAALKPATLIGSLFVTMALLVLGMQAEIYVPYFLQQLHAQNPLAAGYYSALMAIGWTLSNLLSASFTPQAGKIAIRSGPFLSLLGLILMAFTLPQPSHGEWERLAPMSLGLMLVGAGIGLAWPHLVTMIFQRAAPEDQLLAPSGVTTIQLFATALGAALAGVVVNSVVPAGAAQPAELTLQALWLCGSFVIVPAAAWWFAQRAIRLADQ